MLKHTLCAASLMICSSLSAQTQTGRQIDMIEAVIGQTTISSAADPTEVFGVRPVSGIFWDARCASVEYTFNSNSGANVGSIDEISPEQLAEVIQRGLDRWNDNPSSYIELNVTQLRNLGDRPRISLDFVNEVTFVTPDGFTALASSPSTSLSADATFVAGDDLDGDGDSDVFDSEIAGINVCTDIDEDGDIEFPAGDYLAGTILDNDVQFSSTVAWELIASDSGAADVDATSTHEFGHSHGLSHSMINQISGNEGNGSTMFPFIDSNDGAAELAVRTPHIDDLAASAHIYQEGSEDAGTLPKIQEGDIPFSEAYSLVSGTVTSNGSPIAGATVLIENREGEIISSTYSGASVVFEDASGGLVLFNESVASGDYVVAVPSGEQYTAHIEAVDGDPVATNSISTNAIVAGLLGNNQFPEEGFTHNDSAIELRSDEATPFFAGRFGRDRIDFETNVELIQRNAGLTDFVGTGAIFGASNIIYGEMFDRELVSQFIASGEFLTSGIFETATIDASLTPTFSKATLAIGELDPNDSSIQILEELRTQESFIGQTNDGARFSFDSPEGLRFAIRNAFNANPDAHLFLLLEANDIVAGPSGFGPVFVQLSVTGAGTSFLSIDDSPLLPLTSALAIELRYTNPGLPVPEYLQDF